MKTLLTLLLAVAIGIAAGSWFGGREFAFSTQFSICLNDKGGCANE